MINGKINLKKSKNKITKFSSIQKEKKRVVVVTFGDAIHINIIKFDSLDIQQR